MSLHGKCSLEFIFRQEPSLVRYEKVQVDWCAGGYNRETVVLVITLTIDDKINNINCCQFIFWPSLTYLISTSLHGVLFLTSGRNWSLVCDWDAAALPGSFTGRLSAEHLNCELICLITQLLVTRIGWTSVCRWTEGDICGRRAAPEVHLLF